MTAIFVLAALLPLALASAVLIGEFSAQLTRREQKDLKALVRGFGMDLIGRLGSADDVLAALAAGADRRPGDRWLITELERLEWVRSVRIRTPDRHEWPQDGRAALTLDFSQGATPAVRIGRPLRGREMVEVELAPGWLWRDLQDAAGDTSLEILDQGGRRLAIGGSHASRARDRGLQALVAGLRDANHRPLATAAQADRWVASHWELFLAGRFRTASWQIIGYRPAASVAASLYSTRLIFPAVVILAVLLVGFLSVRLIRRQLKPLESLVEGTRRVAQLEFSVHVEPEGSDEFADLARSFNGMSDRLRLQFAALETLSGIDRLLLESSSLEPILDVVLPRIAGVLGCASISVVLIDADAADHGRAYDYRSDATQSLPVRRMIDGIASAREAVSGAACVEVPGSDPRFAVLFGPMLRTGANRFLVSGLRHDEVICGFLCAGFPAAQPETASPAAGIADFADRLSVVLANLARAERLHDQAHFDPLTRLANRQQFREVLSRSLTRDGDAAGSGALLYVDLDNFKRVNDTAGHTTGDALLCAVARRIESCFEAANLVARLGGDEFAAIVHHVDTPDDARLAAQRVLNAVRAPIAIDGREYRIEASIGITIFPDDGATIEDLLKNSDMAMYRAKECGRGRAVFFESEMQERMQRHATLETGLHRALENGEFRLLFQPIVACGEQGPCGVEALIRWPTAPGGSSSPAVFVPLAEESDLIIGIGAWVLRTACGEFAAWKASRAGLDYVSVNVSARQLRDPEFVALVTDCLAEARMHARELHLEITESVLADGEAVASCLDALASLGVHLALDDFGTGYSSLGYLHRFPIHSVKIDRSFVAAIPGDASASRLVESIVSMATLLGKQVVAEGVETEAQRHFLEAAGCNSIQGYLFGRPMAAAEIPECPVIVLARRSAATGTTGAPDRAGARNSASPAPRTRSRRSTGSR